MTLASDSPPFAVLIEQGLVAQQAGYPAHALEKYRAALALAPEDAEVLSLCGLALTQCGKAVEAEDLLRKAVANEPDQASFRMNLVQGLEALGRLEEAAGQADAAAALKPENPRIWERLGDLRVRRGDAQGGAEAYGRAAKLAPEGFSTAWKLVRTLVLAGRKDAAFPVLLECNRLEPANLEVLALIAELLADRRDWAELGHFAGQWSRRHPDDSRPWRALSWAAYEQGMAPEALQAFRIAMELRPPTGDDYAVLANLCLAALELQAAGEALARARALEPDNAKVLELLERLDKTGVVLAAADRPPV